jgi:signal transduction histidine kinase
MIERIKKLLAPPIFPDDEEKTRLARLLNLILIIVMTLVMIFSVPALVMTPEIGRVVFEFILAGMAAGMLVMLRRGYVRQAGFLLSLILWVVVTYGTLQAGGFRGSIMSAYYGIILIAELMLGAWAGIIFGVLSILATGGMLVADKFHLLPAPAEYDLMTTFWVEFSVVVVGVVGLLTMVMNSLQNALHRARHNEHELAQRVLEVQEFAQKAVEANEFKSRLIARVSHELRTPIGAMLGIAEMLQLSTYGPLSEEQKRLMQRIVVNSRHLDQVFTEVLEQSQFELGQPRVQEIDMSLTPLLRRIEAIHRPSAEQKGLSLHTRLDTNMPSSIIGDPARIESILTHLVNNAIKFTRKGSITIEIFLVEDQQWALRVSDTGIGIPPDAQDYIFEPFRQVDESISRQYGGMGLGLSIVSQLTQAMQGHITVESQPGEGSVFTVYLPLKTGRLLWNPPTGSRSN